MNRDHVEFLKLLPVLVIGLAAGWRACSWHHARTRADRIVAGVREIWP